MTLVPIGAGKEVNYILYPDELTSAERDGFLNDFQQFAGWREAISAILNSTTNAPEVADSVPAMTDIKASQTATDALKNSVYALDTMFSGSVGMPYSLSITDVADYVWDEPSIGERFWDSGTLALPYERTVEGTYGGTDTVVTLAMLVKSVSGDTFPTTSLYVSEDYADYGTTITTDFNVDVTNFSQMSFDIYVASGGSDYICQIDGGDRISRSGGTNDYVTRTVGLSGDTGVHTVGFGIFTKDATSNARFKNIRFTESA